MSNKQKTVEQDKAPRADLRDKGKEKRDDVRDKARGKRAALRGAAVGLLAVASLALAGCATATPSSKAQSSKACGNVITVNLNIWPGGTNAIASAAAPGSVTVTLSDLIGTQVQSADAGGDESVNQTATPANTSGIVGDKPVETLGEVGKTAITGGASKVVSTVKDAVSGGTTEKAVDAAASGCSGGTCSDAAK